MQMEGGGGGCKLFWSFFCQDVTIWDEEPCTFTQQVSSQSEMLAELTVDNQGSSNPTYPEQIYSGIIMSCVCGHVCVYTRTQTQNTSISGSMW